MSEPKTMQPDKKSAPKAADAAVPNAFEDKPAQANPAQKGHVSGIGKWVFEHKGAFSKNSPLAWYGIRNVLNNMVAIVGLMSVIVPVRMLMGKGAQKADQKITEIVKQASESGTAAQIPSYLSNIKGVLGHPILQNMLGVGLSFSTFRTLYKMGQRSYDRVFGDPKSAEEASQAIADLPKNIWKDFKQIAPVEYPATTTAAVALVGIRSAVTATTVPGGPPDLPANQFKDVMGCAFLAYPVFFEVTERLGRDWQLQRGYKDPKTNEHINKDKMTIGEFLTRQVPAVAAGIIPYIGFNNVAYRSTKRQLSYNAMQVKAGATQIDGFWPAFKKEIPFQFFWMYTLGRDLYYDLYDRITGKSSTPGKHADATPKPDSGVLIAEATPKEKPLATSKQPTVEVADAAQQGKLMGSAEHKKPMQPAANHAAMVTAEHSGAHHAI